MVGLHDRRGKRKKKKTKEKTPKNGDHAFTYSSKVPSKP
jgi:hypothetical protein